MRRASFPIKLCTCAVAFLVMMGCSSWENPVDVPTTPGEQDFQFIKIPHRQVNSLAKVTSGSALVTVEKGGTLRLKSEYDGGPHGTVKISLELKVGRRTVTQDVVITGSFDDKLLLINFGPVGLDFTKPAKLYVKAEGLDFSSLSRTVKVKLFYYNGQLGDWEEIDTKSIKVDVRKGKLECKDAKIEHFSRYAFGF